MARLLAVEVSSQLWQSIVTTGWEGVRNGRKIVCAEGLPEGAELVNSYYDGQRRTAVLVFHHPSFKDVIVGCEVPRQSIVYELRPIDYEETEQT